MSIQQHVMLRYREDGYLRFEIPEVLCAKDTSAWLSQELNQLEGIYRVKVYGGQKKLAIRYLSSVCDFKAVVQKLYSILKTLATREGSKESSHALVATAREKTYLPAKKIPSQVSGFIEAKLQELRETLEALKIIASRSLKAMGMSFTDRPRWAHEFMNDLLMLFMIKMHWQHLLYEWIPRPWTHRYEWAATIYLIYLSVQSKTMPLA